MPRGRVRGVVLACSQGVTHKEMVPGKGEHTALLSLSPMCGRPTNHYTTLHPGPRPQRRTSSGPRKQMARWKTTDSRGLEMKTQFLISGWRSAALPVATSGPRNRIEAGIGSSVAGRSLAPNPGLDWHRFEGRPGIGLEPFLLSG